jgi:hypothetical protein
MTLRFGILTLSDRRLAESERMPPDPRLRVSSRPKAGL